MQFDVGNEITVLQIFNNRQGVTGVSYCGAVVQSSPNQFGDNYTTKPEYKPPVTKESTREHGSAVAPLSVGSPQQFL